MRCRVGRGLCIEINTIIQHPYIDEWELTLQSMIRHQVFAKNKSLMFISEIYSALCIRSDSVSVVLVRHGHGNRDNRPRATIKVAEKQLKRKI